VSALAWLCIAHTWFPGCTRHSTNEHSYLAAININLLLLEDGSRRISGACGSIWRYGGGLGPTSFDHEDEAKKFYTIAARKPAGILVSVANADLMRPEIDEAIAAGIPVITWIRIRRTGSRAEHRFDHLAEALHDGIPGPSRDSMTFIPIRGSGADSLLWARRIAVA
jgi:hypothetical protein